MLIHTPETNKVIRLLNTSHEQKLLCPTTINNPDKQLWMHVILRSVMDMVLHIENINVINDLKVIKRNYKHAREAKSWILSNNTYKQSFLWCVETCFKYQYCEFIIESIRKVANEVTRPDFEALENRIKQTKKPRTKPTKPKPNLD